MAYQGDQDGKGQPPAGGSYSHLQLAQVIPVKAMLIREDKREAFRAEKEGGPPGLLTCRAWRACLGKFLHLGLWRLGTAVYLRLISDLASMVMLFALQTFAMSVYMIFASMHKSSDPGRHTPN